MTHVLSTRELKGELHETLQVSDSFDAIRAHISDDRLHEFDKLLSDSIHARALVVDQRHDPQLARKIFEAIGRAG